MNDTTNPNADPVVSAPPATVIPAPQLRRAWQLASAYGHEGAGALTTDQIETGAYSADQIWDLVSARNDAYEREVGFRPFGGIPFPTVDEDGDIVHTTGTGRLRWIISLDGMVSLEIRRPGPIGVVLRANVHTDGDVWAGDTAPQGAYYQRHVDALETALTALVGEDAARVAAADLRRGAVDGHLSPQVATALTDAIASLHAMQQHAYACCEALRAVRRLTDLLIPQDATSE